MKKNLLNYKEPKEQRKLFRTLFLGSLIVQNAKSLCLKARNSDGTTK